VDVAFLDANVLFSAAWRADSGLSRLGDLTGTELVTSAYAAEEARRNLERPEQGLRLAQLLRSVRIVPEVEAPPGWDALGLPDKDWPILLSASAAGATHLLTGDLRHFGAILGKRVGGLLILRPVDYLRSVTGSRSR
jgi:hypothetical protein